MNFSWTPALFLDLVYDYYDKDRPLFQRLWPGGRKRLRKKRVLNGSKEYRGAASPGLASDLMAAIGDLKNGFYELGRGRVDYEAVKRSREYREYLEMAARLQAFDLGALTSYEEKLAFWINLYNTIVVHGIVELGVTSSVREIPHFFSHLSYRIGKFTFSPEEMEHGILRANERPPYRVLPLFRRNDPRRQFSLARIDPRIHFALVCGSRPCAPIRFYEAEHIDGQLEAAARNFVNSSEVVILPEENKIFLSQIFRWYKKDFGGGKKTIFPFLLQYLDRDERFLFLFEKDWNRITVEYLYYDWNLNH